MDAIGSKIRKQRRRLGLTLDELAGRTGISKPYLSLIETGRVANPPSDDKLRKLEQTLGFGHGELLSHAHLLRTPQDVRVMLQQLLANPTSAPPGTPSGQASSSSSSDAREHGSHLGDSLSQTLRLWSQGGNGQKPHAGAVPLLAAGQQGDYPADFTDLSYPAKAAEQFIGCPDLDDKDAFAARVHGDAMAPKYRQGDVAVFSPAVAARSGDDCFVLLRGAGAAFRQVFFETNGQSRAPVIRLQPRNQLYPPQIVPSDKVSAMYRAVYRFHRVDDDAPLA